MKHKKSVHKKVPFGVKVPKQVPSPTGKPSKVKDTKPSPRPKKVVKKKKKGFRPGTIPRVEKGLEDAGA